MLLAFASYLQSSHSTITFTEITYTTINTRYMRNGFAA